MPPYGSAHIVGRQSFADFVQRAIHWPDNNNTGPTPEGRQVPNYRRHYLPGHTVFVTLVTYRRCPWLADFQRADLLLNSMRRVKTIHAFRHVAHVLMPDHVHWMFEPRDSDFSRIVAAVKRDATWRLKNQGGNGLPPYWQSRFYDHVIRDERDFERHLHYIHYNPVKHGASVRSGAYPHSSFQQWVARGVYDEGWGTAEPESIEGLDLE